MVNVFRVLPDGMINHPIIELLLSKFLLWSCSDYMFRFSLFSYTKSIFSTTTTFSLRLEQIFF